MTGSTYDFGNRSAAGSGPTFTILEGHRGRQALFFYGGSADADFTPQLQESEDGSSWSTTISLANPTMGQTKLVTLKPFMRVNTTSYVAGRWQSLLQVL